MHLPRLQRAVLAHEAALARPRVVLGPADEPRARRAAAGGARGGVEVEAVGAVVGEGGGEGAAARLDAALDLLLFWGF